jgi:hypothetical protein
VKPIRSLPSKIVVLIAFLFIIACLFGNIDDRGRAVLDSIPRHENAILLNESRTTYPDSTPSIIRTYQANATADDLLEYYQSTLTGLDWKIGTWNYEDPNAPKEILAEKNDWRVSIVIYSSGRFTIRIFLN